MKLKLMPVLYGFERVWLVLDLYYYMVLGKGNDCTIDIWEDKWVGRSLIGRVTTLKPQHCKITKVNQLIHNFNWNKALIFQLFNTKDAQNIIRIPINFSKNADWHYWNYDASCIYIVKTKYIEAKKMEIAPSNSSADKGECSRRNQNAALWNFLWKLQL